MPLFTGSENGMNFWFGKLSCLGGILLLLNACVTAPASNQETAITSALEDAALEAQKGYEYETAAAHYQQIYEREPDNLPALIGYSRNLRYAGMARDAIRSLRKGVKEHGKKPGLLLELAKAQLAGSLLNDGRETLEVLLDLDPDNWEVHSSSGILFDRLGQFDVAQTAYERALELSPGNVAVQNNRALSLAQAGKLDEAIASLGKVAHGENSTPQTRQNLATLYAAKGDMAQAERLAREDLPPEILKENLATYRQFQKRPPVKTTPVARAPQAAVAGTAQFIQPRSYFTLIRSNVRAGPSVKSDRITWLKKYQTVKVIGKSRNKRWYVIDLGEGRKGYVFHTLLVEKTVNP
jgi:Flp pilus assembly protein TadD